MKFIVNQPKLRLDRFLAQNFSEASRSRIQKDIVAGSVLVNGKEILEAKTVVRSGDAIEYNFVAEEKISAKPLDIQILFENNDILIIDKPAGLVVHPAPGYKGVTLAEGLLHKYKDINVVGDEEIRPGIVHRLDKDTSGVMLVAKNQKTFEFLKDAFAHRRIRKEYIALLQGRIPSKHGFINTAIGRHATDFRKMSVLRPKDPKEAITEYSVLEYFPKEQSAMPVDELTLVRVKLHTGRTHQIRVHFSSLGFPIAGDSLYGKSKIIPPHLKILGLARQFLHAEKIEVQLPDNSWIEAESALPSDLQKVLNNLRENHS